eukprot:SAG31_NODE_7381_length_1704_cov_1.357632_1_plen_282_part_10
MKELEKYKTCLDRHFVQLEIKEAWRHDRNMITVFEEDMRKQGYFDYGKAWEKYEGLSWEVVDADPFPVDKLLGIDAVTYRRDRHEAQAMLNRILERAVAQDTAAAENPINQPGEWDFFLSHGQGATGDQVNALALLLEQRGKTVWYDMRMSDRSTDAMLEGCKHCANFILFLSGDRRFEGQESDEIEQDLFWTRYQRTGVELGAGAQGSVFAARDTKMGREVAIKVVRPRSDRLVFTDAEQKRLVREANATIRVHHNNVVTCYEWVLAPKQHEFCHVLELVK